MDSKQSVKDPQLYQKRKKKRSLNQQFIKRFKKSPSFSKGTQFEAVEHEYFMCVFKLERIFEGSIEEKRVFANNALKQTEGREVDCAYNQLISRVIENLLPLASNEVLEKYYEAFGVNLRPICVHEFASHVLQALMITATKHILVTDENADSAHIDHCKTWLLKVSKFLLNNIEEFIWEVYANPVLRTAMLCLAGVPQLDKHAKADTRPTTNDSHPDSDTAPNSVPEEFISLLEEFFTRVSNWPQFQQLVEDSLSSGYLQCLLKTLKLTGSKQYKRLFKKILTDCFPSSTGEGSPVPLSPMALFVLEVMIEHSKEKQRKKLYNQLLLPRLVQMSTGRVGNITVQKFLKKCTNAEMVGEIVSLLVPHFSKILGQGNEALLTSLCQACQRLTFAQSEFYQGIMKLLNCDGSEESQQQLVPAILSLTPLPHDQPPSTTTHGSLMLQSLLNFQKPIKLVNSLLMYEPKQLADVLSSPSGSHVTGAFCKSEYIGEKSRHKLIQQLLGHYPYLAQSKFGSRSFDDLWDVATLKERAQIAKDLASDFSQVMSSQFGKFVASKVRLDDYRTLGVDRWKARIQQIQNKKGLFADIIGDVK